MKVYTRTGDDGTTGLFYGGRVSKDSAHPMAYGAVDEAQAAFGMARAETDDADLDAVLVSICRGLYVAMAELATLPENRTKLTEGTNLVSAAMVEQLERTIDDISERFDPPTQFVIPGADRTTAALDLARTIVRRAERHALAVAAPDSHVIAYLNRLSDLAWTLARWQEPATLASRDAGTASR